MFLHEIIAYLSTLQTYYTKLRPSSFSTHTIEKAQFSIRRKEKISQEKNNK
jgi:hypothetical protein